MDNGIFYHTNVGKSIGRRFILHNEYVWLASICQTPYTLRGRILKNGGFTLKTHQMFSNHTTLEEFENGGFTLETHQMFSVHTTPEDLKTEVSL